MIQRELKSVSVYSFTSGRDSYGQTRKSGSTSRTIEMVVHPSSYQVVNDIRYSDVEYIGLTKDSSISNKDELVIDGISYIILYIIPSQRMNQVLFKKKV